MASHTPRPLCGGGGGSGGGSGGGGRGGSSFGSRQEHMRWELMAPRRCRRAAIPLLLQLQLPRAGRAALLLCDVAAVGVRRLSATCSNGRALWAAAAAAAAVAPPMTRQLHVRHDQLADVSDGGGGGANRCL